jgi:hypothetical protein
MPHAIPHLLPPEVVKRSVRGERRAALLGQDARVRSFDLVEIDPTPDVAGMTAKTGATALLTFLGGLYTRLQRKT